MEIFSKHALAYWEKNIPVIPLVCLDKMPITNIWQKFCREMPSKEQQDQWLGYNKSNNIGLPCGVQSNIIIIDYDYERPDDPALEAKVEAAMMTVLKQSPWKRVGRRGWACAYKYNPKIDAKKQIHDAAGRIVVEILSNGSQIVLPPSIHPKTMKEYIANCELVDVLDQLPMLPDDLEEQLRAAIGQVVDLQSKYKGKFKGIAMVPAGSRDIQMTRSAGFRARMVMSGECTLKNALEDMTQWVADKVQQTVGDPVDAQKGCRQIINFLIGDVTTGSKILPAGWDANITPEEKTDWGLNFDAAFEEWTLQECLTYIEAANVHKADSAERRAAIDFILRKLSKTAKLTFLETEEILVALKSDTKMTVAALKKQLRQMKQGVIEGLSHTEIAKEVIKEMETKHGQLAFWNGDIWSWEGAHWAPMGEQVIRNFIQTQFGELLMSKKYADHKGIVMVIKDLLPQTIKPVVNVQGVNFANGFLNSDLKLLAHSPEFGMTYTLPFSYRPDLSGKCPKFLEFLHYSWGDDEDYGQKLMALQEAMSTTLFGSATSYQRAFLLYGVENTGKSLLTEIISAMVPDEARCAVSPETWADDYIAAQFASKILNVCGELDEKKFLGGKLFKEVVAGDEITSRCIYGSPFKFRPRAAHWFASNHLPKSKDTSGGFNRRWLILKFNKVVPPEKIIRDYSQQIVYEEIEGIVAWALEAYPRLLQSPNYTLPASHIEISEEMGKMNSTVRAWMYEFVTLKTDGPVLVRAEKDVYQSFWLYSAAKVQSHTMSMTNWHLEFNNILASKGWPQGQMTSEGVVYKGLEIKK